MQYKKHPPCLNCKHRIKDNKKYICLAFKDFIPNLIISGENDHKNPLPQQNNDIVFEPVNQKI